MNKVTSKSKIWIRETWRPMMAYVYMAVIIFDFIVGPIFWGVIQLNVELLVQWVPLTLSGGGVFHAAMGAVLGITAFTRGQEKVEQLRTSMNNTESSQILTEDDSSRG